MNEEITKMSLLITHLDVSTETKEKLYTQNYKIATEIERLNNGINELKEELEISKNLNICVGCEINQEEET